MPNAAATWHNLPAHSVLDTLSSTDSGLTDEDAAGRLARHGPNVLRLTRPTPAWKILLNPFRSLVVLLLVAATANAGAVRQVRENVRSINTHAVILEAE